MTYTRPYKTWAMTSRMFRQIDLKLNLTSSSKQMYMEKKIGDAALVLLYQDIDQAEEQVNKQ